MPITLPVEVNTVPAMAMESSPSVCQDGVDVFARHCCIERDLASIGWGSSPGR